jgi:hypothetical protein
MIVAWNWCMDMLYGVWITMTVKVKKKHGDTRDTGDNQG